MPDARWSVDLSVTDGPRLRGDGELAVEGYDRITVTVPKANGGKKTVTVQVQPGAAKAVRLLVLTASAYLVEGKVALTYQVDGQPDPGVDLDAPLFLVGPGAVSLLGAVQAIALTNSAKQDVVVDILVGRTATATPP